MQLIDHSSFQIGQAELPLLDRTYYSSNSSTTAAYLSFMREITEALNDGSEVDEKDIEEMFQLERKIAQVLCSFISSSLLRITTELL